MSLPSTHKINIERILILIYIDAGEIGTTYPSMENYKKCIPVPNNSLFTIFFNATVFVRFWSIKILTGIKFSSNEQSTGFYPEVMTQINALASYIDRSGSALNEGKMQDMNCDGAARVLLITYEPCYKEVPFKIIIRKFVGPNS